MRLLFRAASLLAILLMVGCGGDKRAKVTGKVTVAGKGPLTGGNIRFVSVADPNRIGGGLIKADGTYEVPDAPVGDCKVVIDNAHLDPNPTSQAKTPGPPGVGAPKISPEDLKKLTTPPKGAPLPPGANAGAGEMKFVKIDDAFSKAETTPLTFKVEDGPNAKDFDVK